MQWCCDRCALISHDIWHRCQCSCGEPGGRQHPERRRRPQEAPPGAVAARPPRLHDLPPRWYRGWHNSAVDAVPPCAAGTTASHGLPPAASPVHVFRSGSGECEWHNGGRDAACQFSPAFLSVVWIRITALCHLPYRHTWRAVCMFHAVCLVCILTLSTLST